MEPVVGQLGRSCGLDDARSEYGIVVLAMGDGLDRVVRCALPGGRWHTVGASCVPPHRTVRIPEDSLLHALLSHRTCDAPWLTEAWQRAGPTPAAGPALAEPPAAGPACQSPDDGYGEETADEADEPPEDDEWSLSESGSDGEPYDNIPRGRDPDDLFDRDRYGEVVALQDISPTVELDAERLAVMHNLAALAILHDARHRRQQAVGGPRQTALESLFNNAIPRCVALWRWLQRCCCSCCCCRVPCQRRDE